MDRSTDLAAHDEPANDTTPEQIEAPRVKVLPPQFDQRCYPIGEPRTPGFRYCAAPVAQPGAVYCLEHKRLCIEGRRGMSGVIAPVMGYNNRQQASLNARLVVFCEAIAELRERACRRNRMVPANPLVARLPDTCGCSGSLNGRNNCCP